MHEIEQVLADPAVHNVIANFSDGLARRVGAGIAGFLVEKVGRFGKARLSAESIETVVTSLERLERLYNRLADEVAALKGTPNELTEDAIRTAFNDPQGAAALTAANEAAIETDDEETIELLAGMLVER